MSSQQHNRLNENLREYWESVRQGRSFPEERDIDPDAIKDIWDSCFLVKKVPDSAYPAFRYDFLGKQLIDAFGDDVTNQEISSKLVDPTSPPLVKGFVHVVENAEPTEEDSEFINSQGLLVKYRSCMLPLGNAKDGVMYILGGMKWKSF